MRFVSYDLGLGGKAFVIGTGEEGKKAADLAYANRESVAALYLDGPVLKKKEPSKLAGELSKAGIPVLLMFGTMDKVASPEACAQFEEEFSKGGGNITTVRRELFGHYPLGLEAARVGIITSFVQAALK
jgi:predicted esterase